jgi:transposase
VRGHRLYALFHLVALRGLRRGEAAGLLERVTPAGAVQQARWELAADLLDDLRRADERLRETGKKLATAVQATGTTLTEVFGVGPVIAATVIGEIGDISRFAGRDSFAAYNGTAPIEVSSGKRKVHRLSRRGNGRLNHAAHMTAVTQIRYQHSPGRAYYEKKLAEGKTAKEALRALKRQVSDAFYKHLKADAARAARPAEKSLQVLDTKRLRYARQAHGAGRSRMPRGKGEILRWGRVLTLP